MFCSFVGLFKLSFDRPNGAEGNELEPLSCFFLLSLTSFLLLSHIFGGWILGCFPRFQQCLLLAKILETSLRTFLLTHSQRVFWGLPSKTPMEMFYLHCNCVHGIWHSLFYSIKLKIFFLQAYTNHDIIITRCHSISLCLVVCIIIYFVK